MYDLHQRGMRAHVEHSVDRRDRVRTEGNASSDTADERHESADAKRDPNELEDRDRNFEWPADVAAVERKPEPATMAVSADARPCRPCRSRIGRDDVFKTGQRRTDTRRERTTSKDRCCWDASSLDEASLPRDKLAPNVVTDMNGGRRPRVVERLDRRMHERHCTAVAIGVDEEVLKQAHDTLITVLLEDVTSQKCSHFHDGVGVLRKRDRKRAELRKLQ